MYRNFFRRIDTDTHLLAGENRIGLSTRDIRLLRIGCDLLEKGLGCVKDADKVLMNDLFSVSAEHNKIGTRLFSHR